MSSDVDNIINELDRTIASILRSIEQGKPITIKQKTSKLGFEIAANINIGYLDSLVAPNIKEPKEPLIDVIEYSDSVKVIVMIPGIKKEDIHTSVGDGFIEIQITNSEKPFRRKIPCNVKPHQLFTKSLSYNNSVVEIVFGKGAK